MDSHATADGNPSETQIRPRKVALFLALPFGIAWVYAIVLYFVRIELGTFVELVLVVVLFMWAPAIG